MSSAQKDILATTPQGAPNGSEEQLRNRVNASCDISDAALNHSPKAEGGRELLGAEDGRLEDQTLNGTPKSHNQDLVFFRAKGGSLNIKELTVLNGYRAVEIGERESEEEAELDTVEEVENNDVNDNNNACVGVRRSSCVSISMNLNKYIDRQERIKGSADGLRRDDSTTDGRVGNAVNGTVATNLDAASAVSAKNAAKAAKDSNGGTTPQVSGKKPTQGHKTRKRGMSVYKPPLCLYKNGRFVGSTHNYAEAVRLCERTARDEGAVCYLKFSQKLLVYCTAESTAYFYNFNNWHSEHKLTPPSTPSDVFATAYAEERVRQLEDAANNNKQAT